MLNPEIFRQYDIRGIAGRDMDEDDVVLLGRGIGTYLHRQGNTYIAVGRDCRVSSDDYAERLIEGLTATGCRVVDIGMCPTPVCYFAIRHLPTQGAVMVTASHNPPSNERTSPSDMPWPTARTVSNTVLPGSMVSAKSCDW